MGCHERKEAENMPLFYKRYPNSIGATILSILSSTGILFAILGVYEIYLGIERKSDDILAGIIFLVIGIAIKFFLSRAAKTIAEKKKDNTEV